MTREQLSNVLARMHHELTIEEAPFLYCDYGRGSVFIAGHTFDRLPKFQLYHLLADCMTILEGKEHVSFLCKTRKWT